MKKWLSAAAAVVVLSLALVIGIACGGGGEEDTGAKKLKLGIGNCFIGATGAVAGLPFKWTLDVLNDQIGEFEVGGERYYWDIIHEENQLNIEGGRLSATKLIYDHGVDFMFQAASDPAIAAQELTEAVGMILFTGAGNAFDIGPDTPHAFQTFQCYQLELPPFFDYIAKEHPEVKRIATTTDESRRGQGWGDSVRAICDYYGFELKLEIVPYGTMEFYPVATKLVTYDPDLVLGGIQLFDAMYDMGWDGLCANGFWSEAFGGAVDWDRFRGMLIYSIHPLGDAFPELNAIAQEVEDRYGAETTPVIWLGPSVLPVLTQALQKAGTVDDMDKILQTLETETFDTVVGSAYFGGEPLNGIGHILITPQPIYEALGPNDYQLVKMYTAEEGEALANAIFGGQ